MNDHLTIYLFCAALVLVSVTGFYLVCRFVVLPLWVALTTPLILFFYHASQTEGFKSFDRVFTRTCKKIIKWTLIGLASAAIIIFTCFFPFFVFVILPCAYVFFFKLTAEQQTAVANIALLVWIIDRLHS